MKNVIFLLVFSVLLGGCGPDASDSPMPMTQEGMDRVNEALAQHDTPQILQSTGAKSEDALEAMIGVFNKAFEGAGYSFESTMIAVDKGVNGGTEKEQKEYLEQSEETVGQMLQIAAMLDALARQADKDLSDYLSKDAAQAVADIAQATGGYYN